jgi:hypothetical protein
MRTAVAQEPACADSARIAALMNALVSKGALSESDTQIIAADAFALLNSIAHTGLVTALQQKVTPALR